ncbi:MAG: phosphopyruvate hydratase [Candidatus Bathyarchaeota archaeon]|nr:phosphopyruvate hydratase [Candidatus Bathyarchaeota archaeon]
MSREIKEIRAREVLNVKGFPIIEADVITKGGVLGRSAAPVGTSTGKYEAVTLTDGGERYFGRGALTAVKNVNEIIAPELTGRDVTNQRGIDIAMIKLDGTANKSRLGGNAILAVSLAVARAAAASMDIPLYRYLGGMTACILPVPFFVTISGGKHHRSDTNIEDYHLIPCGVRTFPEALYAVRQIYHELEQIFEKKYGKQAVNFAPDGTYVISTMQSDREPMEALTEAIEQAGYGKKVGFQFDVAASNFYSEEKKKYIISGKEQPREFLIDFYKDVVSDYPILSIEDPFDEDDFEAHAILRKELKIQIIGDDLFASNPKRLLRGIEMGAANAMLFKVNQIGTLSEAMDAAHLAFANDYGVVPSPRTGGIGDTWEVDMAVGLTCGQAKLGSVVGRNYNYNYLLRIMEDLGNSAKFAGGEYIKTG